MVYSQINTILVKLEIYETTLTQKNFIKSIGADLFLYTNIYQNAQQMKG